MDGSVTLFLLFDFIFTLDLDGTFERSISNMYRTLFLTQNRNVRIKILISAHTPREIYFFSFQIYYLKLFRSH